jgi:chemotaxis protein MotB
MKEENLIIKKIKKTDHKSQHGSSWKVAYADFVTALMSLFLILWLLTMSAPEKRARVSTYFKSFSLFDQSGSSFMENGIGIMENNEEGELEKGLRDIEEGEFKKGLRDIEEDIDTVSREEWKEILDKEIKTKLSDFKDQIIVDIFEWGIKIQLIDSNDNSMFPLGSSKPTLEAQKILKVIAKNIKDIDSDIAIEGHTDALSYSSAHYSNWELSTERASFARKELENNGLNPDRIIRVVGYASKEPLIKDNPYDPRNRRISIMLFYNNTKERKL